MIELKSILRPSRFGFRGKQVACESSWVSDNANCGTSHASSSPDDDKDASECYSRHADRKGGGEPEKKFLQRQPSSSRRVRGLWNDRHSCSAFAQLQAEIISDRIFAFLTLEDRVMSALTCRRFAYCCQQPGCWATNVDATSYVKRLYDMHLMRASNELASSNSSDASRSISPQQLAKERTSAALIALITGHNNDIERLVIRNIDHRLSSDVAAMGIGACLAAGRLIEVTLTEYLELTDVTVSVMFLSRFCGGDDSTQTIRPRKVAIPTQQSLATNTRHTGGAKIVSISPRFKLVEKENASPPRRPIADLRLEKCPLLTDKVIRLIASNCSGLSRLSLRECRGITDSGVLALLPMINRSIKSSHSQASPLSSDRIDPFVPSPATSAVPQNQTPMLTPPASPMTLGRSMSDPKKPTSNSLSSIFESSSPSSVAVASSLPSLLSFLSIFDQNQSGDQPSTHTYRPITRSGITVQKASSLPRILPKEAQCDGKDAQKRYLTSLDLAYTGVSIEGIIKPCSSDNGDSMLVSIDELILSSVGDSKMSPKRVKKLRSLLMKPTSLNILVGDEGRP